MALTTPAVNPLVLKDVTLTFGPSAGTQYDFKKHVDQVTFTPSSSQMTWTGLGSNTHSDVTTATWTVALSYVQDWDSATSLSRYLFTNEGQEIDVIFKPKSAGSMTVTATVVITPGAIGGSVNAYAAATVTLGLKAKPTLS